MPLLHGLHGPFAWTALGQVAAISLSRGCPLAMGSPGGYWPRSLDDYARYTSERFPDMDSQADFFVPQAKKPVPSAPRIGGRVQCAPGGLCGVDTRQSPGIGAPLKGPAVGSVCPLRCRGARQIDGR